jgi:hypothetical protein
MAYNILSLFDFSGNWSRPWKDAGYNVLQVDIKHDINILELEVDDIPFDSVYGILAAPPCTDFASSGAQYWKAKDLDGRTAHSLAMVDKVLEFVKYYEPTFWALENPVGRLSKLRPTLGNPWYFQPHEFAGWCTSKEQQEHERYTKKTGLWGKFNKPAKIDPGNNPNNDWIMRLGGKSERTKELRSMTPTGFAIAFFEANKF